jgi:hypothetical protein
VNRKGRYFRELFLQFLESPCRAFFFHMMHLASSRVAEPEGPAIDKSLPDAHFRKDIQSPFNQGAGCLESNQTIAPMNKYFSSVFLEKSHWKNITMQ